MHPIWSTTLRRLRCTCTTLFAPYQSQNLSGLDQITLKQDSFERPDNPGMYY